MTLEECYDVFGGSYQDVKQRLLSDALIERFVNKFLTDSSYEMLCTAVEAGDCEGAFRAAHTLKGICQNLSFRRLAESAGRMTEYLRGKEEVEGDKQYCEELLQQIKKDYDAVVQAVIEYEQ